MWIDDQVIKRCGEGFSVETWVPDATMVVLGSSNQAEVEAHVDHCRADDVPILKRYGGGGAVVLYPGCVILSVGCWVKNYYENQRYFQMLNAAVADVLSAQTGLPIGQKGISDLCIGERKIGGTSLFRSKNYLLYQASLICENKPEVITRYLKHPSREPDYRAGRSHKDFLVGLAQLSARGDVLAIMQALQKSFEASAKTYLVDELIDVQQDHISVLMARAGWAK